MIEKDDSQHAEAGLIGSTTKHQAGTILGQRFFCIEILHMSQISLGTIHWSFIFLRKRHTYLGGISLRIVVSTQKLSFSSFPQREKDSSIMGSIKGATSLERGVCSSYTIGKPSPSLLSWSGLHLLTSSCLMGPWVSGSQPHHYKREERSSLSKGPRSQN